MEHSSYCLVLTGDVLPSHSEETVWPELAAYFRMDLAKLKTQLVARAPITIKQGDDLGKLQTLQAGMAAIGAEAEICAPDERANLFVVLGNTPRGPVPRVLVEDRVERGLWPARVSVAEVGSTAWRAYADLDAPATPVTAPAPAPAFDSAAGAARDASHAHAPTASADHGHSLAATAVAADTASGRIPPGDAIHAGFWRRCAAMLIDGVLLAIAMSVLNAAVGLGMMGSVVTGDDPSAAITAMMGTMTLVWGLSIVLQWLYFALFEASASMATPGKSAMGLKVVDERGQRIGFGRASGRFFGKLVSSIAFGIGYLMAAFTERKQALHDLMAGTLVVFRDVTPGQPMPATRAPMPWWGWLVNIVFLGLPIVAGMLAFWALAGALGSIHW